MPRLQDTAYPRLTSVLTARDLASAFTPTPDEVLLARRSANGPVAQLGFLILLKLFQRLGRPVPLAEAPRSAIEHVARLAGRPGVALAVEGYDRSGTRRRHLVIIRDYLGVRPYGPAARHAMIRALAEAASTKHVLEDLINVAIEQLVRQRYELPAFDTLNRAARRVRATLTRATYARVFHALRDDDLARLDMLFVTDLTTLRTPWNELKADAGNPTLGHLRALVARPRWLASQTVGTAALADLPAAKVQHFAEEPGRWTPPVCKPWSRTSGRRWPWPCWRPKPHVRWTTSARCSSAACSTSTRPPGPPWSTTGRRPSSAPMGWSRPCTTCSWPTRRTARSTSASRPWTR